MVTLPLEIISKIMLYNSTLEADLMRDHPIKSYNCYITWLKKYFPNKEPLSFYKYFKRLNYPQPA